MRKLLMMGSIVLLFAVILPLKLNAQADPGCDPFDPLCPIDGGVTFLIAAGIGLGAKRALKKSNQE